MKKLQLIIFIPIIVGIGLIAGGAVSGNSTLMMSGIPVLFGGSFLCAIITVLVVVIKAVRGSDTKSSASNGKTSAAESFDDTSTATESESKYEAAERQISNAAKIYKSAPNGDKIKGCIFVIAFVGCLVVGMVLMFIGYELPGGIVFGCAFLIIIGAAIISSSAQRRSLSRRYNPDDYVKKTAVVESCSEASTTTVNGRVTKVIYRLTVNADGEYHDVYTPEYYSNGDKVQVLIHKNGKIAKLASTVISNSDGYDDYEDDASAFDGNDGDDEDVDVDDIALYNDDRDEITDREILRRGSKATEKLSKLREYMDDDASEEGESSNSESVADTAEENDKTDVEPNAADVSKKADDSVSTDKAKEQKSEFESELTKKPSVGYKGINRKK